MTQQDDDPRPFPPREPEPEECCGSGCDPCVWDRYGDALDAYRAALKAWEARERARRVRSTAPARWATRLQFMALGILVGTWGTHIPSVKARYALSEATLSLVLLAVAIGTVLVALHRRTRRRTARRAQDLGARGVVA